MILVTGATGNVGREVVAQLADLGANVRALTRSPGSAGLPDSVDVVQGDHSDPAALDAGLDGVDAVFLMWPFGTTEAAPAMVDAIARRVRRVVFLSSGAVRDDLERQDNPIGEVHAAVERPIVRSGVEWTFLRPLGFAANTLAWAPGIRTEGVVRDVHGAATMTLIHERDMAAVAVRALTEPGHAGAKYLLTGPDLLSQTEQVQAIGEAIGRPLRWEEVPPDTARQQRLAQGWPPSFVDHYLDGYARMVTEPGPMTSTVEEVTGTPARTFREWAFDHADDFR